MLLTEFELLRALNEVSARYGGSRVGGAGMIEMWHEDDGELRLSGGGWTFRNQWLISVELEGSFPEWTVRLGFCQTNITRAPRGGFELYVGSSLLALCNVADDVVDLVKCMFGTSAERQSSLENWYDHVTAWRAQRTGTQAAVWEMNSLVRQAGLDVAVETGGIY